MPTCRSAGSNTLDAALALVQRARTCRYGHSRKRMSRSRANCTNSTRVRGRETSAILASCRRRGVGEIMTFDRTLGAVGLTSASRGG